jgi:hypothetical protein
MDRASQVIVNGLPKGVPTTYLTLSEWGQVPYSNIYYRARGRRSKEEKARSQQYLTPAEEKALAQYLKRSADLGNPVPIKYLRSLAFSIRCRCLAVDAADAAIKPPGKNWLKAFEKRNPVLKARKVKAVE